MGKSIKIDFVSDVSCPWCAIGLNALERALANIGAEAAPELRFQPFELNPNMGPEGQDITEHLRQKYGASAEQQEQTRAMIRQRGADVGFDFAMGKRSRIYNTFDAHRLLHWAGELGPQAQGALKHALFEAYFTLGADPSAHPVLAAAAAKAGLDPVEAAAVLASGRYAAEVRELELFYQRQGIGSVPAVVINDRHLISGGQPAEVFERVLREILAAS
ncbi:DsbA family oxidoreductase [Pseudoduganella namucuonensis]|uniref:Predicted dithiol-disulfide isomerase, DsbA family n=1 Tax=Pseudoduganella namucuonensis TaxID=1035707 RepID=A0A1I7FUV7_9BURK|nr:DsbA family oxidoreductase [Pseudoduganella namucuonensis]SFU39948.1 Predicted dithiol-disulfide isomerase, DsbA family [Pseudoduganella namucuonensis]